MKLIELFTEDMLKLIAEHDVLTKLDNFLYKNKDCNEVIRGSFSMDKYASMPWSHRRYQIERELQILLHKAFNGMSVVAANFPMEGSRNGKIKVELMREYNGTTFKDGAYMCYDDYEASKQLPFLWIDNGGRGSHACNPRQIEVVEELVPIA